jgi:hypothetical protein
MAVTEESCSGGYVAVPWEAMAAVSGEHGTVDGKGLGRHGEKKMTLSKRWEGRRKGIERFLNCLMFVTDEHKRATPRVPYLLMFIGDVPN